jgi:cysteine protease ATG4
VHTPIVTVEQKAPEYDEDVRSENDFGIMSDEDEDEEENDMF